MSKITKKETTLAYIIVTGITLFLVVCLIFSFIYMGYSSGYAKCATDVHKILLEKDINN